MRKLKLLLLLGLMFIGGNVFAQYLPPSYQPMFTEIVENFETITSGNSINQGKNSLRVINEERIVLRIQHKGKVKNLTFETKLDEENNKVWIAANDLTIDMVNKYEKDLTKTLESLYKLSEKKSQE